MLRWNVSIVRENCESPIEVRGRLGHRVAALLAGGDAGFVFEIAGRGRALKAAGNSPQTPPWREQQPDRSVSYVHVGEREPSQHFT